MPAIRQGKVVPRVDVDVAPVAVRPVMVVDVSKSVTTGPIMVTRGASELLERATGTDFQVLMRRYRRGDWGDVGEDSKRENDSAVANSTRLGYMGVYNVTGGTIWIITDYGREVTTVLLPEER